MPSSEPILTVAQMRAAEEALIQAGSSVEALMDVAGRGAADWVWRMAARGRVTVLCGPGNNGGDGYVIAQSIHARGGDVVVMAAHAPRTPAAQNARALYRGEVVSRDAEVRGEVVVDCLFGSGLSRVLQPEDAALLRRLAASHGLSIAIDVPSGVEADSGAWLGEEPPRFDATLALGAWKFAHVLMPAAAHMGAARLVPIGIYAGEDAARMIAKPVFHAPAPDAHKYSRGLLGIVAGRMPGAAVLAATAAQGAGAGYVRLLSEAEGPIPDDLVRDDRPLTDAVGDKRLNAILVGPGLGRDAHARERLAATLARGTPTVLDADGLMLLTPDAVCDRRAPIIATPHEGELAALERSFALDGSGTKPERARALASASGMIVVAKGPDTVIAAGDGRLACAGRATSWLSTAGTGDVLAGAIASRLATGADPFAAACEGVWLHAEAARLVPPPFTAATLAGAISKAYQACL